MDRRLSRTSSPPFTQHTQRPVKIETSGEIQFRLEGKLLYFVPPPSLPGGQTGSVPSVKSLLGYCNPDDPKFLHLTNGQGAVMGTWLRKDLASNQEELRAAITHSAAALQSVRQAAHDLNAPERETLDRMRAHNAELLAANTFVDIAPAPRFTGAPALSSPVASVLTTVAAQTKAQLKAEQKREQEYEARARANRRKAASMF
jgi:hypothetical protein